MTADKVRSEQKKLRELARRTLEAFRELNAAAAESAFMRSQSANGESMVRAGDLLEAVVAELKGKSKVPA